ncbi:MAG TPA: SusC/RagA family TonB-linked outer membrane protein [Mucilaginibacter sp.]|jgi:TonB-linked SusC/RagA family outer membrane protein|nr:SusC/RagA family TonB-linked outer membrane protein [Mucilaginibacter sp.]
MKKLLLTSMVVLLLIASHAYAQTRTITGTVTDKDGSPLPGVSVVVKGTKTGTQTSVQGKFAINAGAGKQTLMFTFIGYLPKIVDVPGSTVGVIMEPDQNQLSEVLVVGYGTQNRRENVGSIAQIKGSDIIEQPVQNFEQAIAGKAAGVQVTITNGVLNTPPVFHIRGTNSINLSSQPLIVVDGVVSLSGDYSGGESGGNALSNINPDDIESIDVAKDASATAIYGSRGANGVVFITTKKGKKGDAIVSLDSWTGVTTVNRLPKVLNAAQYVAIKTEAIGNLPASATNPSIADGTDVNGNPIDTKWANLIYQRAVSYNTTASVSGGNDKTTYYASANWSKQQGVLRANEFDNKSILFNIDHKANKYITLGMKISYADQLNLAATTSGSLAGEAYNTAGLGRLALLLPPNLPAYNNDGTYNLNPANGAIGVGLDKNVTISYTNPVVALALDRANNEINHAVGDVYLQVKPLSWITLKSTYGIDYLYSTNDLFFDPADNFSGSAANNTASAYANYSSNKRWDWANTAQFDHTFGKHSLSLLFGNEQQYTSVSGFGLERTVLSDPAFNVIQAGYVNVLTYGLNLTNNYLVSFFGRLNYNFDEKYFLSASLRKDGYSAFGFDKKYGYFPSIGGGWEITKEGFWNNIGADKIFSSFKIKASYGRVGNNALGDFSSYGTYASGLFNGKPTLLPSTTGNNQLAWETSTKTDIGFDFGILNDRINGSIGVYKDNVSGLILPYPEPPSAGLPGAAPLVNIGSIYNRGVEININADIVRTKDFKWSSNFNISFNQNKITALLPGQNALPPYSTSSLETTSIDKVGGSIGDLYIIRSAGVDPNNGDRIFLNAAGHKVEYNFNGVNIPGLGLAHYFNLDGTPYLTAAGGLNTINQTADAIDYGNATPKEYGGFSNSFRYKNFDLSVLLTYQLGFYVYYGTQATLTDQRFWNNSTIILNHWTTPGQIAAYPKVIFGDNVSNGTSFPTDFNTYRGDFVKVKTINFGYTIPKTFLNKVGVRSVRVYVTGQNLFIITKYPGPDPEVGSNGTLNNTPGVDRNTAGNGRTVTAGFSLKF